MCEIYRPGFKKGDIVTFCDELYRVVENYGTQGDVEYLDGEYVGNMYWDFQGERALLFPPKE